MITGIDCEYEIFQHCYYMDLFQSFAELQRVALREKDNPRYHMSNFRLEDFNGPGYAEMSGIFLDKMGVAKHNGRSDAANEDIEWHRKELMEEMSKHDLANSKKNSHATQGTYNKTLQIDILLKDPVRCRTLKKQGLDMNYEWKYPEKC